jgi:hypothetical protein
MSELTEERWAVLSERGCEAMGLTYAEARDMLIHAFAGQVLDGVRIQPLREALEAELFEQLAKDLAEVDAGRK